MSVGLTGVNGSVSATKTKTESKNSSQNRDVVGSKIKAGGNIKMEGNKVELVSAEIEGDRGVGIKAKDSIEIRSAASTSESSYESDSDSKTVSVNVGVTWGGVPTVGGGISGSKSHSEGESSSKEYEQGIIKGGEIKIETGDMKMEGGSIEGESINIKAEDVKIGSVQDEYSRRDESSEISAGISVGGSKGESGWVGNAGGNLGVGKSKSESSGKNVKEQAGIVANKQLEMEVGNKLGLNSATLEGKEGSKIEAGEIEIKEMEDSNSSKSEGYKVAGGYSFSFGGGSTQEEGSSKAGKSKGSKGVIGSINSVRDGVYNAGGYIPDVKVDINKREKGEISKINSSIGSGVGIESNKIIIDNDDMGIDSINRDVENNRTEISSYDSGYNLEIAPKQWTNNLGGALGTTSDYIKLGGETVKMGIKTSGEVRGWLNHIGFGKVYGELNIVDEVQKESRKEGINIIANGKEYGKLVKDKGYTDDEVETIVYAMETKINGYSDKGMNEIGINIIRKDNELATVGDIENTMWHELTHQRERGEETEYDREDHANIIGSSAEILGGVNNWMYGEGGLNSGSINRYYNTNLANNNLEKNNEYLRNKNPNNLEYYLERRDRLLTAGINFSLYNSTIDMKKNNSNDPYLKEKNTILYLTHGYLVAEMSKKDFDNVIEKKGAYDIKPMGVEGTDRVKVIISGFPDKGQVETILGNSNLIVKYNAEEDLAFDRKGEYHATIIDERDEVAIKALELSIDYRNNTEGVRSVKYSLVPELYNIEIERMKIGESHKYYFAKFMGGNVDYAYNSNSLATSLSLYSGARKWDIDHEGGSPGREEIIPEEHFRN